MDKTSTVRLRQRISFRYPFFYHGRACHEKGHLWNLSPSGLRGTGEHRVIQGLAMPVSIVLPSRKIHVLARRIRSCPVVGLIRFRGEISTMGEPSRVMLMQFVDQFRLSLRG